jgi:hypothetical protein
MTVEYPLKWPQGWPRARSRKDGLFRRRDSTSAGGLSYAAGERRIIDELRLMKIDVQRGDVVIVSSNVLRDREPADPGVAAYFQKAGGAMRVIAIDIYNRAADNAAAIGATLEALRAIERHGGAQIMERAFTGFDALPAPSSWRQVLGLVNGTPTLDDVEIAYRARARKTHPDAGGSAAAFQELNQAREAARRELGAS